MHRGADAVELGERRIGVSGRALIAVCQRATLAGQMSRNAQYVQER